MPSILSKQLDKALVAEVPDMPGNFQDRLLVSKVSPGFLKAAVVQCLLTVACVVAPACVSASDGRGSDALRDVCVHAVPNCMDNTVKHAWQVL